MTADIVKRWEIASPHLVLGAVDVFCQRDIRNVTWATSCAGKAHASLPQHLVPLLRVAAAAAGNEVLPMHRAAMALWHNVVDGQVPRLRPAVLAGVVIPSENRSSGQLELRQRAANMVAQPHYGRCLNLTIGHAQRDVTVVQVQNVSLAKEHKHNRSSQIADVQRFVITIEY